MQMDNRQLDLAIPETRAESLASGDGLDPEDEDESDIKETLEYVALRPCSYTDHGLVVARSVCCCSTIDR